MKKNQDNENFLVSGTIIVIVAFIVGIYFLFKKDEKPVKNKNLKQSARQQKMAFINPKPFTTGYIANSPQKIASVCGGVMYPVNPVYVNYGEGPNCKCDNLIFNSAP